MKRIGIVAVLILLLPVVSFAGSQSKMWWLYNLPADEKVYLDNDRYIAGDSTNYEIDVSTGLNITGTLKLNAGISGNYTVKTQTTTITLTTADAGLIYLSTTTACAVAVVLPSTTTACDTTNEQGVIFEFFNYSIVGTTYTLTGAGAELINGSNTNAELNAQYDYLKIQAFPDGWGIIGRYIH